MVKGLLGVALAFQLMSLSSCEIFRGEYREQREVEKLIDNVEKRDVEGVREMFAPNIVKNLTDFDQQIEALFDYYEGTYEKTTLFSCDGGGLNSNFSYIRYSSLVKWTIKTTEHYYYINMLWYYMDDLDSDNIGIWNLQLQECSTPDDYFVPLTSWDEWLEGDSYRGISFVEKGDSSDDEE